jgi:hypothetical protein
LTSTNTNTFPRHPKRNVLLHMSKPMLGFLNDLQKRGSISLFEATSCYPATLKTLKKFEQAGIITFQEARA